MPLIMQNFCLGLANLYRKIKRLLFSQKPPVFNYKQGWWVHAKYDDQCHLGVVRNVNYTENLLNVRCLNVRSIKRQMDSWWKFEPEIDTVWCIESDILGHAEHEPLMDQRGALCNLSKYRLNQTKQI